MGFIAPWFLAGLAAVGLPVYFHLLKRHKTTPLPFASLMFFERRTQASIKHRRLQYLLLFALRLAFIILLVLAFARPFIPSSAVASAHGARTLALCIDDSYSMKQGGRLEQAKQDALKVIAGLGAADRAQVLAFGGPTRVLTDMVNDKEALKAAVTEIHQTDMASSYSEVARALRSISEAVKAPLVAHLFSDMQQSSMPAAFSDLKLSSNTDLIMHADANRQIPNFTVDNVNAPRRVFDPKKSRVLVTVAGYGTEPAVRKVTLMLNGKILGSKTVQVPASGRADVQFPTLDASYGSNRGEVRIDGADSFPDDDHFYFAVERSDPRPALFLRPANDTRSLSYFKTAMEAAREPAFILETAAVEQAGNLNLSRFAFIVVCDTGTLPKGLEQNLTTYVTAGGQLLVVLGRSFASGGAVPVAGLKADGAHYAASEAIRFQTVAYADGTYPPIHHNNLWNGVRFYQSVVVEPAQARVLAKLADDTPLLLEQPVGEGRVVVFASTFDNIGNDFPGSNAFVPFVEQTAQYLGGLEGGSSNFNAGAFVDLRTAKEKGAPVEVIGPDGKRALSLSESTKAQTFQLANEGYYEIRRANGRHELDAVNPDRRESDFALVPPDVLKLWENTGQTTLSTGAASPEPTKSRNDLWWYVMIAALGLAVAESLIGNRHLSVDKEVA
jgi:Aerotolerance regulator N-terminal/von Willebrand factor type A domain